MQTTRTPYSVSFMATVLLLFLFACHSTIANAAVALGATRVIYPANQKQVLLPVTNNDPASVYLIQSWIENAGDQKDTQFVITPPLFSMQSTPLIISYQATVKACSGLMLKLSLLWKKTRRMRIHYSWQLLAA